MFKKILLAYNGSHEGKSALLACAEIAAFAIRKPTFSRWPACPRACS